MGLLESVTPTVATPHRREYLWGGQLKVVFAKFSPTNNGLSCWVEVRWIGNIPNPELIAFGRFDLMSSRTVPSLTKMCESNHGKDDGIPFSRLLTGICYDVVRDHLEGKPTVVLADVEPAPTSWLLKPLIGGVGSSSFVGPGGVGKSFFALGAMVTVASGRTGILGMKPQRTGPVMHLDWESDEDTQNKRLAAVCAPLGLEVPRNILYRGQEGPLWNRTEEIAAAVASDRVVLVVVDSVMLARGGDAFGPEGTIMLYSALRQIGVPTLLIDHKSREAIRKGWKGSFGSVVNDNSTRLMWEFEPGSDMPDQSLTQFKLVQSKRNNDRKRAPLGFEMKITNGPDDEIEAVKFTPVDVNTIVAFSTAEDAPLADQILVALLRAGNLGMTPKELMEETGGGKSVYTRLKDMEKQGKVFKRVDRWFVVGMDSQRRTGTDPGFTEPPEVPW